SLPHGSADRNDGMGDVPAAVGTSLPHGSADRNANGKSLCRAKNPSRSLTGARIETTLTGRTAGARESLPHGSADRNVAASGGTGTFTGRSLTGARIETDDLPLAVAPSDRRSLTGARIET